MPSVVALEFIFFVRKRIIYLYKKVDKKSKNVIYKAIRQKRKLKNKNN
jgi:hypothetical protein